jgi:Predicted carboxypeptidase
MKISLNYDHYYDYQELTKALNNFEQKYPHIFAKESLIKTLEGKDVWAVTITNKETGCADSKPAYYIDANIHAGEVTGSMTALYVIDALCTNSSSEEVAKLLADYTYYIIPMVSPDGVDAYLNSSEKMRSVNRPYPSTEKTPGLHPSDIDGDGIITMMRIKSKYGAWKISENDTRIMTKRLPSDLGEDFYHVYPEGEIIDYDGYNIKLAKNKWGLDYNRNFPFGWFTEVRQPGAGKYPLSNVETKALADFILAHKNIGFVSALHTTGGVFIYPPGTYSEKDAIPSDMKLYHDLGLLAEQLTGYKTKNIFDEFLVDTVNYSSGAFDDWCYEMQGIPSYTIELWDLMLRAGVADEKVRAIGKTDLEKQSEYEKAVKWLDENVGKDCFKPWKKATHPQLGEVEIGGFNFKFTLQNPPTAYLQQEVEKTGKYLIKSAAALPKVTIDDVQVEVVSTDVYKITAVIGNTGYMDTNLTGKALQQKVNKPVKATLAGDFTIINGKKTQKCGDIIGFGSSNSTYSYDGIHTNPKGAQIKLVTWVISTINKTPLTLTITSEKGGIVTQEILL